MLNKKDEFTYFREKSNYKEILDIFMCSSNLYSNISDCAVDYDSELHSDHIPVRLLLNENNNIYKFDIFKFYTKI